MEKDQLKNLQLCTTFLRQGDSYHAWMCFKASGIRLKDEDFDRVMKCMKSKDFAGLVVALQAGIGNLFGRDML